MKTVEEFILWARFLILGFSGGSDGKESACNAGDQGSIPGSGRSPGKGNSQPTPVFLPGEFHGQRSLAGCHLWGHKELDMTNTFTFHMYLYVCVYIYRERDRDVYILIEI